MAAKKIRKDTLIAILKSERDLSIAQNQKWYRIPIKTAPKIVCDKKIIFLALYQPTVFKKEPCQIRWYAKVDGINIVKRKDLLPNEADDPRANNDYYKITFSELLPLKQPVVNSLKSRRVIFITTTFKRLQQARDLNDLFHESPIEERMWQGLKKARIKAERQYWVNLPTDTFCLDFVVFAKSRKIDIECDGDAYHTGVAPVKADKKRDNLLESHGWSILRYPTDEIMTHLPHCITQIKATIHRHGGLQQQGK